MESDPNRVNVNRLAVTKPSSYIVVTFVNISNNIRLSGAVDTCQIFN